MTLPSGGRRSANRFERAYAASVEDLWKLWTTPAGLQAWLGPECSCVDVKKLELHVGGEVCYDVIPASGSVTRTRGLFVEIVPCRRLEIVFTVEVAGTDHHPYYLLVDFFPEGSAVRMAVTVEPDDDAEWTRARCVEEGRLGRLAAALAARSVPERVRG